MSSDNLPARIEAFDHFPVPSNDNVRRAERFRMPTPDPAEVIAVDPTALEAVTTCGLGEIVVKALEDDVAVTNSFFDGDVYIELVDVRDATITDSIVTSDGSLTHGMSKRIDNAIVTNCLIQDSTVRYAYVRDSWIYADSVVVGIESTRQRNERPHVIGCRLSRTDIEDGATILNSSADRSRIGNNAYVENSVLEKALVRGKAKVTNAHLSTCIVMARDKRKAANSLELNEGDLESYVENVVLEGIDLRGCTVRGDSAEEPLVLKFKREGEGTVRIEDALIDPQHPIVGFELPWKYEAGMVKDETYTVTQETAYVSAYYTRSSNGEKLGIMVGNVFFDGGTGTAVDQLQTYLDTGRAGSYEGQLFGNLARETYRVQLQKIVDVIRESQMPKQLGRAPGV